MSEAGDSAAAGEDAAGEAHAHFLACAGALERLARPGEVLLASLRGEESEFARINRARLRYAGQVTRRTLDLALVANPGDGPGDGDGARRHAVATLELSGDAGADRARLARILPELRARALADPHLRFSETPAASAEVVPGRLPAAGDVREALAAADGLDLVGAWASGTVHAGFASSLGHRHWYQAPRFHVDWSCHLGDSTAAKGEYAGAEWSSRALRARLDASRRELALLARPARTIAPGPHRAWLAPAALAEILELVAREGFSWRAHALGHSPLAGMLRDARALHPTVHLAEDRRAGLVPRFGPAGFVHAARVPLVENGACGERLVDPRSEREFGVAANSAHEWPQALALAPGAIAASGAAARLGRGLWLGRLWYANFSDLHACRITATTRFGCFVVEDGEIRAPLAPVRIDESLYRLLGEHLAGLGAEAELCLDPHTYGHRSLASMRLPGALVDGVRVVG